MHGNNWKSRNILVIQASKILKTSYTYSNSCYQHTKWTIWSNWKNRAKGSRILILQTFLLGSLCLFTFPQMTYLPSLLDYGWETRDVGHLRKNFWPGRGSSCKGEQDWPVFVPRILVWRWSGFSMRYWHRAEVIFVDMPQMTPFFTHTHNNTLHCTLLHYTIHILHSSMTISVPTSRLWTSAPN